MTIFQDKQNTFTKSFSVIAVIPHGNCSKVHYIKDYKPFLKKKLYIYFGEEIIKMLCQISSWFQ